MHYIITSLLALCIVLPAPLAVYAAIVLHDPLYIVYAALYGALLLYVRHIDHQE